MRVLIIGGSFCGLAAAKDLLQARTKTPDLDIEVTLVEPRDYVDNTFMAPRLLQEPNEHTRTIHTLASIPWLSDAKIVHAKVVELQKHRANLSNGENIAFDYCIIASGSSYSSTYCKDTGTTAYNDRITAIVSTAERVKAAKSVLVIGGGITGMEVAGEACEAGAADVTLVHSGQHLGATEKQGRKFAERLTKQGVKLVYGKRVKAVDEGRKVFTWDGARDRNGQSAGEKSFDEVFWCTGNKPATEFASGLGVLTADGHIDVNAHFQVKGFEHIYAVGDSVLVDDTQLAYVGIQHAQLAVKNMLITAKSNKNLKKWKRNGGLKLNLVVLGKKNCMAWIGKSTTLPAPAFVSWMKSDKTNAMLGIV